ncbi:NAD(P)-dependent oxidoreductase [Gimibacter soli]|uniref:DUF1932 domain-containing protein n=1 Tax=Gimibacter soli TaxID=3024400 RepID=A0AAE9XM52_9PROT|nr:NAD(P)-dependent oxidoreductase [Gimibacter soli]WCL53423.1 DUF1932 domain-containing protein [Gimibacter soli]
MKQDLAIIGFGEAGEIFAVAANWRTDARVFDIATTEAASADGMQNRYSTAGVHGCASLEDAIAGRAVILSLVTAESSLAVARKAAGHMAAGSLYFDMNSVSPGTKREAAAFIEGAGGRYVDVAIMAPINPARLDVPLLVSGEWGAEAEAMLTGLGFRSVRRVEGGVGRASAIKMVRSVMIKGIEALTAECMLAASAAGVVDDVLASLGAEWADKTNYNLDRMLVHGLRRAAEMDEVVRTLDELGVDPLITRGTVVRQRALGSMGHKKPPQDLAAKLALITGKKEAAE